jgi:hypothetical protein
MLDLSARPTQSISRVPAIPPEGDAAVRKSSEAGFQGVGQTAADVRASVTSIISSAEAAAEMKYAFFTSDRAITDINMPRDLFAPRVSYYEYVRRDPRYYCRKPMLERLMLTFDLYLKYNNGVIGDDFFEEALAKAQAYCDMKLEPGDVFALADGSFATLQFLQIEALLLHPDFMKDPRAVQFAKIFADNNINLPVNPKLTVERLRLNPVNRFGHGGSSCTA